MQRLAAPLVIALAILILAPAAHAEEPVSTKTIQVWKKGKDTREIDLSTLGKGAQTELDRQMRAKGFAPVELRVLRAFADGRIESEIKSYTKPAIPAAKLRPMPVAPGVPNRLAGDDGKAASPPKPIDRKALEEDIRRMIENGGRLPPDYVPYGRQPMPVPVPPKDPRSGALHPPGKAPASAAAPKKDMLGALAPSLGRLLLRYLSVKDDPLRAPVYERVIRAAAEGLKASPKEGAEAVATRVMTQVMKGLEDPRTAAVCGEILELLAEAAAPEAAPKRTVRLLPKSEPAAPRFAGARFTLEIVGEGDAAQPTLRAVDVPEGSVAWEMSLRKGDAILRVNGKPVVPSTLREAEGAVRKGGQLKLRIRRRNGQTETLDLEFE